MAEPPRHRTSPPALPHELVEEILLRLPHDDPACLLRASFACKAWGRAVSQPDFRGRFIKEHQHRPLPLIGFLHNWEDERVPRFFSTIASPFSLPAPDRASWLALDCRHGRALFLSESEGSGAQQLLVWDLNTGVQRRIPVPPLHSSYVYRTAAVLCPADGCDHRDCNGGPFRVVFVFTMVRCVLMWPGVTSVCVYSSETGTWSGELGKISHQFHALTFTCHSSLLLGRSLLYFMSDGGFILEYDLASNVLTGFETPYNSNKQIFNLMVAEDGGIGVSEGFSSHLKLWSREESDAQWVLSRVIHLQNSLPPAALVDAEAELMVLGFAEGVNVIFVNTVAGLFTIELQSERVKKVCDDHGFCNLIPVVSFYTPVDRLEYQDLLPSIPSENVGDEEGGEEEKTVDEAQQLLDKGSNTIKEGGFVDAVERVSHDLNARVGGHGEVAPGCASTFDKYECAYIAQEVNDSLDDVSRSVSNEESVKGTSSKDDAEDSKTSGSNGEDAAPSSEKEILYFL
ncbi:unnamed protein product [Triticum turgidum subsp. durum]|uniref:F-box domain-containing protein n=1 Tax=Triticum turgidum subsp. durum TaxID=4567 RepID=A0A9R0SNM4_TRITD|nr:unnamed protein product [Triticum turgidum subsp. durum]